MGNPSLNYNSLFTNFFAQDTWKPTRNLTVTYGLRYDLYQMPSADKTSPFVLFAELPDGQEQLRTAARRCVGTGQGPEDGDPRQLGHLLRSAADRPVPARDLAERQSGLLHAFGDAGDELRAELPERVHGAAGGRHGEHGHHDDLPGFRESVLDQREFLDQPGADVEHGAHRVVPVHDGQPPAGVSQHQRGAERHVPGGRTADLRTARYYAGFDNIMSAESVGHSTYNGLNVTLRKQLAQGLELYATYTWSHAIDDAPEQNNIDAGANLLSDPTNRRRDRGDSLTDKRHVFNMTGVFMPEFKSDNKVVNYLANHNRLSLRIVASSGDLFNWAATAC